MFERFTDNARKALAMANQEASKYCHEYIGTEDILLGLLEHNSGKAITILIDRDYDLKALRREARKRAKKAPQLLTLKRSPGAPRAKKVIEYAIQFARQRNDPYIGTEHILFGLMQEEGDAYQVLTKVGFTQQKLEEALYNMPAPRTKQKKKAWKAPKPTLGEFLQSNGYMVGPKIARKEELPYFEIAKEGRILGVALCPESEAGKEIPEIRRARPILEYKVFGEKLEAGHIEAVLELRSLLDQNNYAYTEDPSSGYVAKMLRRVADKVEGSEGKKPSLYNAAKLDIYPFEPSD